MSGHSAPRTQQAGASFANREGYSHERRQAIGRWAPGHADLPSAADLTTGVYMHRLSKHAAGKTLDGQIHNAYPEVANA
jgi:hypothetical protein